MKHSDISPGAKCPYHAMTGQDLTDLGTLVNRVLNNLESDSWQTADGHPSLFITDYVGNPRRHPSMHNQGKWFAEGMRAIPEREQTPVERLIGGIHASYRDGAIAIGELLDTESLSRATIAQIDAYDKAVIAYRNAVLTTRDHPKAEKRLPNAALLTEKDKIDFEDPLKATVMALRKSELENAATIPIHIQGGGMKSIPNIDMGKVKLGMFLFALREAGSAQVDTNKIPESILYSLTDLIGSQHNIPAHWDKFTAPELQAQVRAINHAIHDDSIARIQKESHAMQMINLMFAITGSKARDGAAELCKQAGIDAFPKALSPSKKDQVKEALAIMQCLSTAMGLKELVLDSNPLLDVAEKLRAGEQPTRRDIAAAEAAMKRPQMQEKMKRSDAFAAGYTLVKGFLAQYRQPAHPRIPKQDTEKSGNIGI